MRISEAFGPTIQGEGIHAGQRCGFIRLADCNLACSWCDTPYTWDWSRFDKDAETQEVTVSELADTILGWHNNDNVNRVILTGGEPMMQQAQMVELIKASPTDVQFDIETNGTIAPLATLAHLVSMFTVSPKLAHSGDIAKKRLKQIPLDNFASLSWDDQATFKFVCYKESDFDEVDAIVADYGINPAAVWIMPEGMTRQQQIDSIAAIGQTAVNKGYNLTTRLHILVWDTKRGV